MILTDYRPSDNFRFFMALSNWESGVSFWLIMTYWQLGIQFSLIMIVTEQSNALNLTNYENLETEGQELVFNLLWFTDWQSGINFDSLWHLLTKYQELIFNLLRHLSSFAAFVSKLLIRKALYSLLSLMVIMSSDIQYVIHQRIPSRIHKNANIYVFNVSKMFTIAVTICMSSRHCWISNHPVYVSVIFVRDIPTSVRNKFTAELIPWEAELAVAGKRNYILHPFH